MTKAKILLVEDNPITRKMMRVTLQGAGYAVLEAEDARSALEVADRDRPDLILQDLTLPDMDGFELAGRLRESIGPAAPIVAFSGHELAQRDRSAFTDGILKPVEASHLLELVQAYLAHAESGASSRMRVLVVDDTESQAKLMKRLLERRGFEVAAVSDGRKALEKAREWMPDAVVSDVLMPVMDGFQLCGALREEERFRRMPIVLVSSEYVEEEDRRIAKALGATALLARTGSAANVLALIEKAVRAGHPEGSAAAQPAETARLQIRRLTDLAILRSRHIALLETGLKILTSLPEFVRDGTTIPQLLEELLLRFLDAVGLSCGAVFLADESGLHVARCHGMSGFPEGILDFPTLTESFEQEQPVVLDPARPDHRRLLDRAGAASGILAPMRQAGKPIGILMIASGEEVFGEKWVPLASALAAQLAQCLALSRALGSESAVQHRCQVLMDQANDGIAVLDTDGTILEVNRRLVEILGYSREEQVGRNFREFVDSSQRPGVSERFERIGQTGRQDTNGVRLRRADGSYVVMDWTSALVDLDPPRVLSIGRDVTERSRIQEELERARARLNELLVASPAAIYACNPRGNYAVSYMSPNIERILGWSADDFVSNPDFWPAGLHPADRDGVLAALEESAVTGILQVEYRFRHRDGSWRWMRDEGRLVRDETGSVKELVGSWTDITDQRALEEAQRSTEERLQAILDNAPVAIYTKDCDGRYTFVNRFAERGLGVPSDRVLGRTDADLLPPAEAALVRSNDLQVLEGGAAREFEETITLNGSRRVQRSVRFPLRDRQGNVTAICGISTDITEKQRIEEMLRHSQKMEAIGRLSGGIAHDFNNLLTVINGYSEMLLRRPGTPEVELHEILNAGKRAAGLTRQLLTFSRRQTFSSQVLDLNAVIGDIEKMLRRLIGEDVKLVTRLAPGLGRVKADPGQIEQVLLNLAVNARDAMPKGGRITIETADAVYEQRPFVQIVVTDEGVGMDRETQSHLFEPFFTTKEPGKGSGLGLATVYGIVKKFGGHITVDSEVGVGSCFRVYLPRVEEPVAKPVEPSGGIPRGGGETILLVEDDPSVRSMARMTLKSLGYTVLEAQHGIQALDVARAEGSRIRLVITDVVMPEMGGPEMSTRIGELAPKAKILFMSGYTDKRFEAAGLGGGYSFLEKPFTIESLGRKVAEMLRG